MCYDTYETTEEKQARHGVPFPSHGWPTVHPTESQNLASINTHADNKVGWQQLLQDALQRVPTENHQRYHALLFMLSLNTPTEDTDRLHRELEELLASGTLPENSLNTLLWYMGIEPGAVDSGTVEVHQDGGDEKQRCESSAQFTAALRGGPRGSAEGIVAQASPEES